LFLRAFDLPIRIWGFPPFRLFRAKATNFSYQARYFAVFLLVQKFVARYRGVSSLVYRPYHQRRASAHISGGENGRKAALIIRVAGQDAAFFALYLADSRQITPGIPSKKRFRLLDAIIGALKSGGMSAMTVV
jgi:hypothetical protein